MKEYDVDQDLLVAKKSDEIDAFCSAARITVEKFILTCREMNRMPSYDSFRLWMADPVANINNVREELQG
jgi:hypothetical protein